MRFRKSAISVCVVLALGACATSGKAPPSPREIDAALAEITGQDSRSCVRQADISGYAALDDSVVSVSAKFRKHYLMVTMYRCPAMESTAHALFEGAFTEFCGGGRDSIATANGRCPIQSVYEFENRQEAFDVYDKAEEMARAARKPAGPVEE